MTNFDSNYTSTWGQYDFNPEEYRAFLSRLAQDLGITDRDEIGGGLSGARTSSVQIDGKGSAQIRMGRYILKVCLLEDAEQEIEKHKLARAKISSILHRHIPDIVASWSYPDMRLKAILYQVAGNTELTSTTFQRSLEQNAFQRTRIDNLANDILRWNIETNSTGSTHDLLDCIRNGLRLDHLTSLKERLARIVEQIEHPRVDLHWLENSTYYNPVYFLLKQDVCPSLEKIRYGITEGLLHRDLHPGNVIIPMPGQVGGSFHIIDFAVSRPGNVFFDLAYLEISILFNSFNGFHSIVDLKNWWQLEKYLNTKALPVLARFDGEGLGRVLPIRRALNRRIKQDSLPDDYWIAFLAASVEAGLDLARKLRRDPYRQRMAFLTAVSRFHHLVELLKASDSDLHKALETLPKPVATIYKPGEEPPAPTGGEREESKRIDSQLGMLPAVLERRVKIELVFPGEINRQAALYDPWMIVDGIVSSLRGENDQGVLLFGERKFGKTSFFNCVGSLFPRNDGSFKTIRVDTLNIPQSIEAFANQLLGKMCRRVDLPIPYGVASQDFDIETFLSACESVVEERPNVRFVIFIDEIDSALTNAVARDDAIAILQLLDRLLTDPYLPIRLVLTASDTEVLRSCPGGTDFVDNLGIRKIPLCSALEVEDLIKRFEGPVPLIFEQNALSRIFYYSGGQVYLVKLAVKASVAQAGGRGGKQLIGAQLVDDLMHAVIEPLSSSFPEISNLHETLFPTMNNIYEKHFSDKEQHFMRLLTVADGVLQATSPQASQEELANVANTLYRRGYINKTVIGEAVEYSWRIGLWKLFIENHYQLNHH